MEKVTFKKVKDTNKESYIVYLHGIAINEIEVARWKSGKLYAYIYNGFPHKYLAGAKGTARNQFTIMA